MERIYELKDLTCPNCSAKIEHLIRQMKGTRGANYSLATQQLTIDSTIADSDILRERLQAICDAVEKGVTVRLYKRPSKHEEKETALGNIYQLVSIGVGVVALGLVEFTSVISSSWLALWLLLFAYIFLGWQVLWSAFRNCLRGQIFDENFLMAVATLGAVAIGELPEAVGVMLFYQVGEAFEERATKRSRQAVMEAIDMRPDQVRCFSNGQVSLMAPEDVKVGALVEVRVGDRIPLDGVVVEGQSRIDTAPVTGEPVPVAVEKGSQVISGCVNEAGRLVIKVEKALEDSMVSRILDAVEQAAANKPTMDRFITRFARIYTPIVVGLAAFVAVVPSLVFPTHDWWYWIYTALTFLVVSCPCAIVISVPLSFFAGIGAGSKQGILFKGGLSIEAMKAIKALALDKTGTVTTGNFAVQTIQYVPPFDELMLIKYAAALEVQSSHPIAQSIVSYATQKGLFISGVKALQELSGRGLTGQVDGHDVAVGNRKLMQYLQVVGYPQEEPAYGSEVIVAVDNRYAGQIIIADALKEDTIAGVKALRKQGLETVMLTGDAWANANYMADKAGINTVRAELLPTDKVGEMAAIRREFGPVMFVGDGINDAPVLAGADVGGAMGSGADAAIEAADVVYMRSSIASVAQSFRIARATMKIAWQNVIFAIAVKVIIMIMGLAGFANMWLAVFGDTGVTILCVANAIRIFYKKI